MSVFSTATMSVRGIIVSRTKRLPNAIARSTSFSSPAEITPSSSLSRTTCFNSSSEWIPWPPVCPPTPNSFSISAVE